MKIHEFQGKQLFRKFGIPVPEGSVARTPEDAEKIATELEGSIAVVKAQIHAGGRGKGTLVEAPEVHGVKVCKSPEEAKAHAQALLGNTLVTHQTGPEGQQVKQVLVEGGCDIKTELYAAVILDRETSQVSFIVSTEGGMDIEEVAEATPEKILTVGIDPASGIMPFHTRKLCHALGLTGDTAKKGGKLFANLYRTFVESDASMVEINPLVITGSGDVMALDAKLDFDSNALYRQKDIVAMRDRDEEDASEAEANENGLAFVKLDGNIGCLVNGAGLAMATMDIIKLVGGEPANFLDVGGGATAEQVTKAFKIILADPNVKAILVNIFGGIAKCDVIANGVITAAKDIGLELPLVVRLEGTNVELGKKILAESGLAITPADDMHDAATKVVNAAGGAS
ncbi:MAG: ADP-forming succinate--CoA ligase subunit beta [Myxococcota bacterium]|nr:ADP-forming succinate--CoA ligase subunit beta [Myxococcota bacterium]